MVHPARETWSSSRGSVESDYEMGRRMGPAILNRIASKSPLIRYLTIIVGGGLVIMPGTLYVWAGDFCWWSLILTVIGGYILSGPPGDNEDPRE